MSATSGLGNSKFKGELPTELMEQIVSRENMTVANKRVKSNKGSSGVDGMTVEEMKDYLDANWSKLKASLLTDKYQPQQVRVKMIQKAGGGELMLGIPTVVDRLIQQGIHQILSPYYETEFSERSYGFRPKRSVHDALRQARTAIRTGRRWVVDMDLSRFFDEVNHQRLLSKLSKRVKDRRVIHLTERYLRVGMMINGLEQIRSKGTPQGSPLSPLLSNIVLTELDNKLEKRGHYFVRYADDFQIYTKTKRSAERVMESLTEFIERRLKLKVNKEQSQIDRPWKRKYLGYSFTSEKMVRLKPAKESIKRFKNKVKAKMRMGKGRNLGDFVKENLNPLIRGWMNYFSLSETKGFTHDLDSWIRRHLRKIKWRQMKRNWTRRTALIARGLSEEKAVTPAFNQRGAWWNSEASHMNLAYPKTYFEQLGLASLHLMHTRYHLRIISKNRPVRNRTQGGVSGQK
jgi:RNA-directed DNA polymerase